MKCFLLASLVSMLCVAGTDAWARQGAMSVSVRQDDFSEDVAEASEKIRELMMAGRRRGQAQKIWELINRREPAFAQRVLDQLISEDPALKEDCAFRMDQSLIYFWQGDYPRAYGLINSVIAKVESVFPRGVKRGDAEASEIAGIAEAYFTRSSIARKLGMPDVAVADIDRAFALDPQPYMQLNKCRALLQLGRHSEAGRAFDIVYKMSPQTAASSDRTYLCEKLEVHGVRPAACGAAND